MARPSFKARTANGSMLATGADSSPAVKGQRQAQNAHPRPLYTEDQRAAEGGPPSQPSLIVQQVALGSLQRLAMRAQRREGPQLGQPLKMFQSTHAQALERLDAPRAGSTARQGHAQRDHEP